MLTKIKYEKVVKDGEKHIKILSIENVYERERLPKKYINGYPKYYKQNEKTLCIELSRFYSINVIENSVVDKATFQFIIDALKDAGNRLTKINKQEKELKAKWKGKGEVII